MLIIHLTICNPNYLKQPWLRAATGTIKFCPGFLRPSVADPVDFESGPNPYLARSLIGIQIWIRLEAIRILKQGSCLYNSLYPSVCLRIDLSLTHGILYSKLLIVSFMKHKFFFLSNLFALDSFLIIFGYIRRKRGHWGKTIFKKSNLNKIFTYLV